MCFNIHIESLRFLLSKWRIVNTRYRLGRSQVMQLFRNLSELSTSSFFLPFLFFESRPAHVFLQFFFDFLVFVQDPFEMLLTGIEIVLVLSWKVASIVFLNYFGLFAKEFELPALEFFDFFISEYLAGFVASEQPSDKEASRSTIINWWLRTRLSGNAT